jgi:hypothetical protein
MQGALINMLKYGSLGDEGFNIGRLNEVIIEFYDKKTNRKIV